MRGEFPGEFHKIGESKRREGRGWSERERERNGGGQSRMNGID